MAPGTGLGYAEIQPGEVSEKTGQVSVCFHHAPA